MHSDDRVRVLFVGSLVSHTGYARVLRGVVRSLAPALDVHVLALDTFDRVDSEGRAVVHPNPNRVDPYARDVIGHVIDDIAPSAVVFMGEPEAITLMSRRARESRRSVSLAAYVPVDGRILAPRVYEGLLALEAVIACTRFGAAELHRCAGSAGNTGAGTEITVIPHGIDTHKFFPSQVAPDARRAWRGVLGWPELPEARGFVFLNANTNQPRKRLDLTLVAFAEFLAMGGDAWLCLHTRGTAIDLEGIADTMGVRDRVIFHGEGVAQEPDDLLNVLYNACDAGLNTSAGEGWGLVSFEHASTGAPQVITRHPVSVELWPEGAELIEGRPRRGLVQELVDPDPSGVARAMYRLWKDRVYYDGAAEAARRNASRRQWGWDSVARRWFSFLMGFASSKR